MRYLCKTTCFFNTIYFVAGQVYEGHLCTGPDGVVCEHLTPIEGQVEPVIKQNDDDQLAKPPKKSVEKELGYSNKSKVSREDALKDDEF